MSKQDRLLRGGLAAAIAVALGGLVFSNYAQVDKDDGGMRGAHSGGADPAMANDPAAQRARRQWAATVTPPRGAIPADPQSIARAVRDKRMLILQSGLFDPNDPRQNAPNAGVSVSQRYAIVQFQEGAREQRATLEQAGARILGYVPNNAYLVRADGGDIASLQKLNGVRWAGGYRSDMKLAPDLLRQIQGDAAPQAGTTRLTASLFDNESAVRAAQAIQARLPGARMLQVFNDAEAPLLRLEVPGNLLAEALSAISQIDAVQQLTPYVEPQMFNTATIPVLQSNYAPAPGTPEPGEGRVAGPTPIWDQGLVGSGQIVAVFDGQIDRNEAWFAYWRNHDDDAPIAITESATIEPAADNQPLAIGPRQPGNKVVGHWRPAGAADNPHSHGTHVAGIVAGDLSGEFGDSLYSASTTRQPEHDRADGNAPNAQLLGQDLNFITALDNGGAYPYQKLLDQASAAGAGVHNNSWGVGRGGTYEAFSRALDIASYRSDMLVVHAAGNFGDNRDFRFRCRPEEFNGGRCWNSVADPGTAKNNLTVASTRHGSSTEIDAYSSRGTMDGRFKPDIAAPGTQVVSAAAQGASGVTTGGYVPATTPMTGTSMAAPAISAVAALVRQYFTDGFYPSGQRAAADRLAPSSAALKATLLNGTRPTVDPANASSPINNGANDWPILGGGWGRPWLDSNLWFQRTTPGGNDERRLRVFERGNSGGLRTDEQHEYAIAAVRAGQELRITLTWIDPPTTVGSAVAMVNDLDLEVEGPDGRLYRGNQLVAGLSKEFCTRERFNRLRNTPQRCEQAGPANADALNNVEQIRLTAPVAGRYVLRVKGGYVPGAGADLAGSDRQGYALVASGAFGPPAGRAPLAAPTGVRVANRVALPTPGVTVQFNAVANATGYQLYRIEGGCVAGSAAKRYRLVAHQSLDQGGRPTLSDTLIDDNGSYGYAIRAVGADVEGRLSGCVNSVSTAATSAATASTAAANAAVAAVAAQGDAES